MAADRTGLVALIQSRTSSSAELVDIDQDPPWRDAKRVPSRIGDYAGLGVKPPSLEQWARLPLQRFALFKLTRPGHDNGNLIPAMREFGLVQ